MAYQLEHQVRRWSAPEGTIPRFSRRTLLDDDSSAAGGTDLSTDVTMRVLDGNLRVSVFPPRIAEAVSRALSNGDIGDEEPKSMRDDGNDDSDDSESARGGSAAPARAASAAPAAEDNHTTSFVDQGTVFEDDEDGDANDNEHEASIRQGRRQSSRLSTAAKEEGLALCHTVFGKKEGTEVDEGCSEVNDSVGARRRIASGLGASLSAEEAGKALITDDEGAALCRLVTGSRAAADGDGEDDEVTAPVAANGAGWRRASDGSCSSAAAAGAAHLGGASGGEAKAPPAASVASSTTAAGGASSEDSSSSPSLPNGACQAASQSGKVLRSVVLDFKDSTQPWSVRWRFDEAGACVKLLTKGFPSDQELYVGDRLVAINQVNVRGIARKEIETAWRHEQKHNRFVCLKFEGPPAVATMASESG